MESIFPRFPSSKLLVHLADDGLLVPALDVVPLDPVRVKVVEDADAALVLAALEEEEMKEEEREGNEEEEGPAWPPCYPAAASSVLRSATSRSSRTWADTLLSPPFLNVCCL